MSPTSQEVGLFSFGNQINPPIFLADPLTVACVLTLGRTELVFCATAGLLDGSRPFSDIAGHWAEARIEDLHDEGIKSGHTDGTYRP